MHALVGCYVHTTMLIYGVGGVTQYLTMHALVGCYVHTTMRIYGVGGVAGGNGVTVPGVAVCFYAGAPTSVLACYSPVTATWQVLPCTQGHAAGAIAVANRTIYVAGGRVTPYHPVSAENSDLCRHHISFAFRSFWLSFLHTPL
jgi:hypothetical protein